MYIDQKYSMVLTEVLSGSTLGMQMTLLGRLWVQSHNQFDLESLPFPPNSDTDIRILVSSHAYPGLRSLRPG